MSPDGLFAANWAEKHRSLIPAVMILFARAEDVGLVREARAVASAHGSQLLVLLQEGAEEELGAERATALCAAAEIPPKSLFILAQSHPDRMQTCVHR
jgi:hypothetical protein